MSNAELAQLSELIGLIYEGATDPNHWNKTLPAIAEWVGAPRGLLFTPLNSPKDGGFYFNHALPEHVMQLWGTKYQPHDIWAIRAVERNLMFEGNVINGDEIVPFEELITTAFYRDFLSSHDVAHILSGIVFGVGPVQQFPPVVCTLHCGLREGAFSPDQHERLKLLIPHLSRSLGVMMRLKDMELKIASSLSALDRLTAGVLLFDVHGAVSFANRAALRILEEEDGLQLRHLTGSSTLGEVVAEDTRTHAALAKAISGAVSPDIMCTEHFSRAVLVRRPSGREDYTVNFSSLAAQNEFGTGSDAPRAIAFISDNAEPIRLDAELLRRTYGLTPAEIRLTELMAECLTANEAADRLGVSSETIRTHLKNIYGKTNTNSRAKLMRLIMSLAQITG